MLLEEAKEVVSSMDAVAFVKEVWTAVFVAMAGGEEEEEIATLPPPADDASPLKVFAACKSTGDVGLF